MTRQVKEVRGLIYRHYNNMAEFARTIGWPKQRLNKITTGKKVPNLEEVEVLAKSLHTPIGEMAQIFLNHRSPDEQQKEVQ